MKLGLISDTHAEFAIAKPINVNVDVFIAAGDIGVANDLKSLYNMFSIIKDHAEHVVYVLGNHEFYKSDYKSALDKIYTFTQNNNIHLLDIELGTQDLVIDGTTFWGSTLWTDFNNNDFVAKQTAKNFLNDFRLIEHNNKPITPEKIYEINQQSISKINYNADVIITHHSPIIIPNSKYPLDDITYCFSNTTLEQKIVDSKVKVWAYGHSHESMDMDLNGTRVISNQSGYNNAYREEDTGYNSDLIISI